MSAIDPNLIQRYLYILSDKIQSSVSPDQEESLKNKIYQLMPPQDADEYKALYGVQKIFSNIPIKDGKMAEILFGDNLSTISKDVDYIVTHRIMFFIGAEPVYFNIDDINRTNKKIFISNLTIKNQSKEIFTLKANYKASLKINFTDFENLVEKNIRATSVNNPELFFKASILQILYPFMDYPGNQYSKQVADPNGFYIIQTLKFIGDTKKKLIDAGCPIEYTKNYHLTYYKHSFEVFKNEEPIVSVFDNELNAEFVAYETDGTDNSTIKILEKYVPKSNINLFKLLNQQTNFKQEISDLLKTGADNFEKISAKLIELNEKIKKLNNLSTCNNDAPKEDKKQTTDDIKRSKEEVIKIYKDSSILLYYTLLDHIKTWTLDVPDEAWPTYEVGNFLESFMDKLSWAGVLEAAASSAMYGAAGGVAGVAGAAAAGVGIYAAYALVSSITSTKTVQRNVSVPIIRNLYDSNTLKKIEGSILQKLGLGKAIQKSEASTRDMALAAMTGAGVEGSAAAATQAVAEMAEEQKKNVVTGDEILIRLGINIREEGSSAATPVYFTTLGQILGLLMSMEEVREKIDMVCGGYTLDINIQNGETYYINFANMPISMNAYATFLQNVLIKQDRNLFYSTDKFIQDLYEYIVKGVIKDGEITLQSAQNATPKRAKFISHAIRGPKLNFGKSKISTEELFNKIQQKNPIFQKNTEGIINLYVIGSFEDVKYTDFYGAFRKSMSNELTQGSRSRQYNSFEFQKFINTKFEIPCILLRKISNSESILKKKNIQFARLDNKNLETGQFLSGAGLIRQPYQFNADLKLFMNFFVDIGSYMFVAPPLNGTGIIHSNMFGYGGLYILKNSSVEYNFQRLKDENVTIPNFESKCTVTGFIVSHGDSIANLQDQTQENADTGCVELKSDEKQEYQIGNFSRL